MPLPLSLITLILLLLAHMIAGASTPATSSGLRFALHAAASSAQPWGSILSSIVRMGRSHSRTTPGISATRDGQRTASSSTSPSGYLLTLSFHLNRIPFLSEKSSVFGWALDLPNCSIFLMMDSGMGYAVSFCHLFFFPVSMLKNLYKFKHYLFAA
jgi:hypothetical protein